MKTATKIAEQVRWHESLVALASEIATPLAVTLEPSEVNDILQWDIVQVQTGLDKLADSIRRTIDTEDEQSIDTNSARLQNIENAIAALLAVEDVGEAIGSSEVQPETPHREHPAISTRQEFTIIEYAGLFESDMMAMTSDDPLSATMKTHVERSLRVWLLRRAEYGKPVSDAYIKECAAYDAYYRMRVEGTENRKPTEAKADYLRVIEELFSVVRNSPSSSQTTS